MVFIGLYRIGMMKMYVKDVWKNGFNRIHIAMPHTFLIGGVSANRLEAKYYKETKFKILIPTIFSLWGLVNIQYRGKPVDDKTITHKVYNASKGSSAGDGHCFNDLDNYALWNGGVRLVDYGSITTQAILSQYSEEIEKELNNSSHA